MKPIFPSISVLLLFGIIEVKAQTTGQVDLPHLGISFSIPEGWVGQMTDQAYVMGSNTEAGVILMTTHEYKSIDQMRSEAKAGIQDANGTALQLAGELEPISENAIGGEFSGTIEWQRAKAFIAGVLNPFGYGVTVMVATDVANYSEKYVELGIEVVNGLNFAKPERASELEEWKNWFNNAKLTYLDSYYSSGSSYGGYSTGGGYSSEVEIHLCGAGFFRYGSSSSFSIDTGGAFAGSAGSGQGAGTWEVVNAASGEPTLRLNFYNGEVYEYTLTYEDQKTYLNGNRYFVTYGSAGPDYAPNCN